MFIDCLKGCLGTADLTVGVSCWDFWVQLVCPSHCCECFLRFLCFQVSLTIYTIYVRLDSTWRP